MVTKRVLRPDRLRRIPPQFSWIDQRLVREGWIRRCDGHALALYLFLLTVADAKGLSYYSAPAIARRLPLDERRLIEARRDLVDADLIAFDAPLYQVLSLDRAACGEGGDRCASGARHIGEILRLVGASR